MKIKMTTETLLTYDIHALMALYYEGEYSINSPNRKGDGDKKFALEDIKSDKPVTVEQLRDWNNHFKWYSQYYTEISALEARDLELADEFLTAFRRGQSDRVTEIQAETAKITARLKELDGMGVKRTHLADFKVR